MNKALSACLYVFLILSGVAFFASNVEAQGDGIIVEEADYVTTAVNAYSAELINITKEVTPRVIVEYADCNSWLGLNRSDELSEAASIVTPRIMVEYADYNSWLGLYGSDQLNEAASTATPRIMVEYADFNSWLGLNRSDELNEAASTVTPRVMVEYADFAPVYELQDNATLLQVVTDVTPRIIVEYADYVFSSADMEDPFPGPNISNVMQTPLAPDYDDDVEVSASIVGYVPIDQALLSYTYASMWHNASMNELGGIFLATIPAQPYGTVVQYKIYASDTNGKWAVSEPNSYTVGDFVAPEVSLSQTPDYPLSGQKVKIRANVTEPVNASGVRNPVFFSYRVNNGAWWNSTMTFNATLGLYEGIILQQEPKDLVEYFVKAIDNAGNMNTTQVQSYVVGLAGDADYDGDVDYNDFIVLAGAYGSHSGQPAYKIQADFDLDNDVDYNDFVLLAGNYGKHM